MKYCICFWVILVLAGSHLTVKAQTPVEENGQLCVVGLNLCNEDSVPVQLRGMSTHGIQWYSSCINEASLDALAYDWEADILRISLYIQEGGYQTDPEGFTTMVKNIVNEATDRGMYALVDWHQLSPGDPNENLENAITFFTEIASTFKDYPNIIYDICNEPNECSWDTIKYYGDQIIPVIRDIDSNAVILIGTHGWGSLGISDGRSAQDIVSNPLEFPNIMYTFHFYAASHGTEYYNELDWASDRLPLFVTEFGTQTYTGDGGNNYVMAQKYLDLMEEKKISWTNWNYSDDFRSGAVWKTGTCPNGPWTTNQLKEAGLWIRERILGLPPTSLVHEIHSLESNDVRIYPNPAHDFVQISFRSSEPEYFDLQMYDLSGAVVLFQEDMHYRNLDITSLPNGYYLLKIIYSKGIVHRAFSKY